MPIIFTVFFFGLIIFYIKIRTTKTTNEANLKSFIERENIATSVRNKPLNNLPYIHFDKSVYKVLDDNISVSLDQNELFTKTKKYQDNIFNIIDEPMVNFNGKTNTDLKLEFGVSNLNTLINYESTYIEFLHRSTKFVEGLIELGYRIEARRVLEECVRQGSDLSIHQTLLKKL